MKILVKASKDVFTHYGNVELEAEEGETLTLSPSDAEIALSTGDFEFVKEISESDAEKERLATQKTDQEARRAELLEKPHGELFEMAKDFGAKKSMSKPELVEEILKPRAPVGANTPEGDE